MIEYIKDIEDKFQKIDTINNRLNVVDNISANMTSGKQNDEINFKDCIFFGLGAMTAWYLPKIATPEWNNGINGVLLSGFATIVFGNLARMFTGNDRYKYSVMAGGALVTGFKALEICYENCNQKIYEEKEYIRDERFETSVNDIMGELLAGYNRDTDITRDKLDDIKCIIKDDITGIIEMRFGGSVSKHTYVDGLSDIDVLVIVNKSEFSELNPRDILEIVKKKLDDNLSNVKEIHIGRLAVTAKFLDGEEIQLLPAIKIGEGYKIPDQNGDNWSNIIRPDKFAEKLTEVNQSCNGKVVPVVKLAKDIITQFPEDRRLKGYHIESLAIEVFKSYPESNPRTPKIMLRHFFEKAKDIVSRPIKDKTNQSIHVDDYLGQEYSAERMRVSYDLDSIARKIKNADDIGSVKEWKLILGVDN